MKLYSLQNKEGAKSKTGLEVIGGKSARGWREQELFYQLQKLSEGSLVWVLVETSGVLS